MAGGNMAGGGIVLSAGALLSAGVVGLVVFLDSPHPMAVTTATKSVAANHFFIVLVS